MSTAISGTPTSQEMTSAEMVVFPINTCGSGNNMYNQIHSEDLRSGAMVPNVQSEIKMEPPEDINDVGDSASNLSDRTPSDSDGPKIRLTPTTKLMPVTNPVDPKRRFACPYDNCTKSYGKSSHLRSHLTWHTGIKPFVCTELNCGKGFTRSDELNRHVRTHTGEKPFECIQCTKKFSRSDHLTKHLATHVKQMQNKSDGPKKARKEGCAINARKGFLKNDLSDTKISLKDTEFPSDKTKQSQQDFRHQQHDLFKVQQDMLLQQQRDLEEYDSKNGLHFMASLIENGGKKDTVKPIEPLLDHRPIPIKIKLERPENSNEYHVVQPDTPLKTNYSDATSELAIPVPNIKHEDTALDASAPVLPADSAYMDWPDIGQHGSVYDRPWRCNSCAKTFKRQDDLNRHLRTHTGEKPFVCVACDRGFKRSDHLKKHLKTHTNFR